MPLFKVGLGIAMPERTVPFMLTYGTFLGDLGISYTTLNYM